MDGKIEDIDEQAPAVKDTDPKHQAIWDGVRGQAAQNEKANDVASEAEEDEEQGEQAPCDQRDLEPERQSPRRKGHERCGTVDLRENAVHGALKRKLAVHMSKVQKCDI